MNKTFFQQYLELPEFLEYLSAVQRDWPEISEQDFCGLSHCNYLARLTAEKAVLGELIVRPTTFFELNGGKLGTAREEFGFSLTSAINALALRVKSGFIRGPQQ